MPDNQEHKVRFPEYFAPLPDLGMALRRIGLDPDGDYSPSRENLQKLMLAHIMTVPYETLDCCDYKRHVCFAPPWLFQKFVLERRGGYCYEINGFFMAILQGLGYDCYALSGRILFDRQGYAPLSHRLTIATIDGVRYLCDVGYGAGCAEGPVELDRDGVQDILGYRFSIRHHEGGAFGDFTLVKHFADGTEMDFYIAYLRPHTVLEFIHPNECTQKSDRRVVRLRTETGSITVDGTTFRRKVNGEVFETVITSYPQLYEILTTEFGMIVPRYSFSTSWPREFASYGLYT